MRKNSTLILKFNFDFETYSKLTLYYDSCHTSVTYRELHDTDEILDTEVIIMWRKLRT